MKTHRVPLKKDAYPIYLSTQKAGWLSPLKPLVKTNLIVITSPRVARYCLPAVKKELARLKLSFKTLLIPDGEAAKNIQTVMKAYRGLLKLKADRKTTILLLGGGVIGDLGGFVAATYLRGLSFVHVPTTLVAQVDSSIGGKLGIDLPEGKNLVGVFRQPMAIFSHIPFLKTLPEREIRGGMGEVIKYGAIWESKLFDFIRQNKAGILQKDLKVLEHLVDRSTAIKAHVVGKDEKEANLRMILNFGHTLGHAIEKLTHYKRFLHGEAVGIGMVLASRLSRRLGFCTSQEAQKVERLVKMIGLPTQTPHFSKAQWQKALEVDKKSRGGMIHFIFLKRIGQVTVKPISPKNVVKFL